MVNVNVHLITLKMIILHPHLQSKRIVSGEQILLTELGEYFLMVLTMEAEVVKMVEAIPEALEVAEVVEEEIVM